MQSGKVLLLPHARVPECAAIKIQKMKLIGDIDLHVVGIEIRVINTGIVKNAQSPAKSKPEGGIARLL